MTRKARSKAKLNLAHGIPSDLTEQFRLRIESLADFSVKNRYLVDNFFTKFVGPDTDSAELRRSRAISKWLDTECRNELTNERLLFTEEEYNILPRVPFKKFVDWCRDLIRDIIGETVPIEALLGSFSGGASTSRPRTKSHPAFKYLGKAHTTIRTWDLFSDLVEEMPLWFNAQNSLKMTLEFVPGNVLFTVPKKTDIDRCACKEPDLNMFLQKGVGNYFRNSLRRIGINLNDQAHNRSLAHEGSVTGKLITLDLSSASDSVTEGLVALLLPETWYTILDSLRCQVTIIDGVEHRNQMFSSMGNGFTFELESLLFYVLARAVNHFTDTPGIVSVYGDDIISSAESSHLLIYVLNYFGFQVNLDKSCLSGPYRESCGGHYWNGVDITPFYVKAPLSTVIDVIHAANSLREWASLNGTAVECGPVEDIWLWLKTFVPSCLWGGEDTSFKYQLVSNDTPSMRICEETRRSSTGTGGYLHWHNASWERPFEPLKGPRIPLRDFAIRELASQSGSQSSFSERRQVLKSFRLRKVNNSAVPRLRVHFLHEIERGVRVY